MLPTAYAAVTISAIGNARCGAATAYADSGRLAAHVVDAATNARRSTVGVREARTPNGTLSGVTAEHARARHLAGVGLVSASLLMTELALTRIFSVIMYYHFAFLAISIALFGVSASGVFAYVTRQRFAR